MLLDIDLSRALGTEAGEACLSKARVSGFDSQGAAQAILDHLKAYGPASGEVLTLAARLKGYTPADDRSFGPIYAKLARDNKIRCIGYCERRRGHGTAGGRTWSIA